MSSASPLYPENAVFLAPLCDHTDYPFRQLCRRFGCQYCFTELIDAGSLYHHSPHTQQLLYRGTDEPWLAVQVLGGRPDYLDEAVHQLNDHDFQGLDFNLGCPMPKVTKRGCGATLAYDLPQTLICLEAIVRRSRFPVTAKIRILDEQDPEPTLKLAKALEAGGLRALTIHGRVLRQVYAGPVHSAIIAAVQRELRIPVIANGGVFTLADAERLRAETGCSRIMVARGAIGNPWIFQPLTGTGTGVPTHAELCTVLGEQVVGMVRLYGERNGLKCARKIILAYLKGRGYRHSLKEPVCRLATLPEFADFLTVLRREEPVGRPGAALQPGPDTEALLSADPEATEPGTQWKGGR